MEGVSILLIDPSSWEFAINAQRDAKARGIRVSISPASIPLKLEVRIIELHRTRPADERPVSRKP